MKYNFALLSAFASAVSAHSWIEQLIVVGSNGTMTGTPGFARGNVLRSSPGFSDPTMVNLIPPDGRPINQIFSTDLMCKSTQTLGNQTQGSPRLQASAGDNIALRYQENGHVTLPQNQPGKPNNRGTIFVYGTTQSQPDDTFLSIHRVWNADGTGGDRRGVLLSTQNFDDSQCYQVNNGQISETRQKDFAHPANQLMGADLWCQQDIQIPATAASGKPYTLYWVWDWPTLPGTPGFPEGKQEIYTTCMDIDVTAGSQEGNTGASSGSQSNVAANNFIVGQNFASAGVKSELAVVANPTAVTGQFIPFSSASGTPGPTNTDGKNTASTLDSKSSQSSGFSSYLTETGPAAPVATSSIADQASANAGAASTHHHHSRPSVSPIGSLNGNSGQGNNNNNNGGNNNPNSAASSNVNQPAPNANTNANTATAIVTTTPAPVIGAGPSTVTQFSSVFQTVTQTEFETVFFSNSANQKRTAPSAVSTATSSSTRVCSRTEAVYRLRARKPFYILGIGGALGQEDDEC